MDKDRILELADAIENHTIPNLGFDMSGYVSRPPLDRDLTGHPCNTVACIAGHAWTLRTFVEGLTEAGKLPEDIWDAHFSRAAFSTHDAAAMWLDLGYEDANELFLPANFRQRFDRGYEDVTPTQAVKVLRHLAATGEVDWSVAFDD